MKNKVLVSGAGGGIGSRLAEELIKRNVEAYVGVPSLELPLFSGTRVRGVALDYDDRASLDEAMSGKYSLCLRVPPAPRMVDWAENMVGSARRQGVKFILCSSLIEARPDSTDLVFRLYGQIDRLVRESGIDYSIVHANLRMQDFSRHYIDRINSAGEFRSFQGRRSRTSYVDARDLAAVEALILDNPPRHKRMEYTVTGPEALSNEDVAGILSEIAGRRIVYREETENRYLRELRKEGVPDWFVDAYVSLHRHIEGGRNDAVTRDVLLVCGRPALPFRRFAGDYSHIWRKVPVSVGIHDSRRNYSE